MRDSALFRDVALVCVADGIVGISFGATAVAGGLAWWVPVALSVLVFAGGSQIAAVGVVLGGGSPLAAVAAGAVLNTRLFPYGLAVADVIRPGQATLATPGQASLATPGQDTVATPGQASLATPGQATSIPAAEKAGEWRSGRRRLARTARQLVGTHLITDESVAFALRQADPARRRAAFWSCGAGLFAIWNVTVLLGVLAGSMIRDTNAFGLDSTFPAVMLALALPTLTSRSTWVAAGTGAVIAVALTPVLPAGLPLLAALGGLGTRWRGWRRWGGWRHRHPRERGDERRPGELNVGGQR
jgi:predicted branched-subunit amino acid permease